MIRNTLIAFLAIAGVTSAMAGDLPSRKQAPAAPVVTSDSGFYAGLRGGVVFTDNVTIGAGVGYQFSRFIRAEANYDYLNNDKNNVNGLSSSVATGNLIGQYPLAQWGLTPYALAGVGYRWADIKNEPVWNVGAGVRYAVTQNVEVDARYRYISSFANERQGNAFTLGLNYKF